MQSCLACNLVLLPCLIAICAAIAHPPFPAGQDEKQLEMLEGQLTWLVHIIGAVVKGRMNTTGGAGGQRRVGQRGLPTALSHPAQC